MAVAGFLHYTKSTKQALQDLRNSSSKLRPTLRSLPIWHRSRTLSCAEQMTSAVEAFETWSFLAMIRLVQGCRGGIPFSFCGESACLIFTGWVNHGESPRPCEYRCEYEYKQFPGKPAAEVSYKNNLTYRSVPSHMPCGPPFFPARNDGVTQATHNGVALALCMQWLLLLLFVGGSQQRTEVQEHSRCVTDSPHPFVPHSAKSPAR